MLMLFIFDSDTLLCPTLPPLIPSLVDWEMAANLGVDSAYDETWRA